MGFHLPWRYGDTKTKPWLGMGMRSDYEKAAISGGRE